MESRISSLIDRLLLEQGIYSPLELLLAENRLFYNDYEAWRKGELEFLAEALFGDQEQIRRLLANAAEYAQKLGLAPTTVRYLQWDRHQEVRFSNDLELQHLFQLHYQRSTNEPQLDLFMDSPTTTLINSLTLALQSHQHREAQRLLEQLYEVDPSHPQLGDLEQLVGAAQSLSHLIGSPLQALQWIQDQLVPLATGVLQQRARDLLIPHWRTLEAALKKTPFDPEHPRLHTSYCAMQCMDWQHAVDCVEQESRWQQQPVLVRRHAAANSQLRRNPEALLSWFTLCWIAPEMAPSMASDADSSLSNAWLRFSDLEPEMDYQDFPAWLLIFKPGLTRLLPSPEGDSAHSASATYELVYRLLDLKTTRADINAELRRQLQRQNPILFEQFLSNTHSIA